MRGLDQRGVFTLYIMGLAIILGTILTWWLITPLLNYTQEAVNAAGGGGGPFGDEGVSDLLKAIWRWIPIVVLLATVGWMIVMAHRDIWGWRGE